MNLFSTEQWLLLLGSGTFLLLSIWGFSQKRMSVAVAALTVSALFFYSFVAILDPFLHIWDERFHALVAKNLAHHPLLPTLYDQPIVSIAYDRWDRAVVWLHKQPLFLWQIAASYKLWGFNEFGLRFPSALMSALLIPISYRVGKLLMNDATGYIAAILMMSSFYTVQLVSGVQGMEHNDVAFLFYVSASIWAWVEYEHSPIANKWRWAVLIGLFVGAAVLCKWLVGLLVYAAFSSQLLVDPKWKRILHIGMAAAITALIVLPWQFLSFKWYPAEAAFELEYNTLHFTESIEGHGGEFFFHWDMIPVLFGSVVPYVIIPALLGFVFAPKNRRIALAFVAMPILVYVFYSFASTKMQSYPYVVAMPILVCLAFLVQWIVQRISNIIPSKFIGLVLPFVLILLMYSNLRINELLRVHTSYYGENEYHEGLSRNRLIFLGLKDSLPPNSVLFNVSGRHYIEAMFYTDLPSYEMMPTQSEIDQVLAAQMIPVILNDGRVEIPVEFLDDSSIHVVNENIHSYH